MSNAYNDLIYFAHCYFLSRNLETKALLTSHIESQECNTSHLMLQKVKYTLVVYSEFYMLSKFSFRSSLNCITDIPKNHSKEIDLIKFQDWMVECLMSAITELSFACFTWFSSSSGIIGFLKLSQEGHTS